MLRNGYFNHGFHRLHGLLAVLACFLPCINVSHAATKSSPFKQRRAATPGEQGRSPSDTAPEGRLSLFSFRSSLFTHLSRQQGRQLFTPYSVLGTVDALAHQLLASLDIRILLRFGDGIPEGIPAADADLEVFVLFGMDLRILECLGIKDIHLKSCSATL